MNTYEHTQALNLLNKLVKQVMYAYIAVVVAPSHIHIRRDIMMTTVLDFLSPMS
jgi:hypothetical protein